MKEPLVYSVEAAASLLGISRTKAYVCVRTGELRSIEIDGRRLVPAAAIEAFLEDANQIRTRRHRPLRVPIDEGMNRVEVVGRLTRDGELRPTRTGSGLCPLRLAVRRWHSDDAVFIDLVVFGEEASRASHLQKGQLVWVVGRLDQRMWTVEDGSRRETHQIVASQIEAIDLPRTATRKTESIQDKGRISNGSQG
jgi:single-strand DNA-binding protein